MVLAIEFNLPTCRHFQEQNRTRCDDYIISIESKTGLLKFPLAVAVAEFTLCRVKCVVTCQCDSMTVT